MLAYKQKNNTQYRIVDENNSIIAGLFNNESAANVWLTSNGYTINPCCLPQSFSATSNINGFQTYPSTGFYNIDTPIGVEISLNVVWIAFDVPNRFNIYDNSENLVWSSGWRGFSNDAGPWGSSLNTANNGSINISSSNGFKLRVEGLGNTGQDSWNLNTSCNA